MCVGETTGRLVKRLDEHRRAVRKGEMELSALAEYAWKEDHAVGISYQEAAPCIEQKPRPVA